MNSVPVYSSKPPAIHFGVKQDLSENVTQVLKKMMRDYNRRVPEHGQFPAGYEVPFKYRGHTVVFKVAGFMSDPEFYDRRYFEVRVTTATGNSNSKAWLFRGSKSELESNLTTPDAPEKIRAHIDEALDTLQDKKYS